jgi:hypothetical protein
MELDKDKDGNEIFCIDAENRQKLIDMALPPTSTETSGKADRFDHCRYKQRQYCMRKA